NVLSRNGDGCRAMQRLIRDCHDSPKAKKEHVKRSWQLFRSLVDRRIIEIVKDEASGADSQKPAESRRKLRVNVELQEDFSMDQTLSLYLLETIPLVDPKAPDYRFVL